MNNRGYTLFEMTLVLMIIAVVSSLTFGNMKLTYDATKRNEFIYQFQQDLFYTQQLALSHHLSASVVIRNNTNEYIIRQGGVVKLTRQFDENITFIPATLSLNDITFLHDGNARKAGTLIIKIGDHSYRFVLLLGRGRFYLEQL